LPNADLFSLGVITYQMLSGRLPYGAQVAKARTKAAQKKLKYASVLDEQREIPVWVDAALAKAVHPDPFKRYEELSEFIHDLRHPNNALLGKGAAPADRTQPADLLAMPVRCVGGRRAPPAGHAPDPEIAAGKRKAKLKK